MSIRFCVNSSISPPSSSDPIAIVVLLRGGGGRVDPSGWLVDTAAAEEWLLGATGPVAAVVTCGRDDGAVEGAAPAPAEVVCFTMVPLRCGAAAAAAVVVVVEE